MSEQILVNYLSQGLVTNTLSSLEFRQLASTVDGHFSEKESATCYEEIQEHDKKVLDNINVRVHEFFEGTRALSKETVEAAQLKNSVSVESLVNSLYAAHHLLDGKIAQLDSIINVYSSELQTFERTVNSFKHSATIQPILEVLKTLLKRAEEINN
ncbi:LANO_0F06744g1_1 [Lachancea nothofagi CBS 11611]|uniref:LANO_0F06744g1_1 n=1 Tax=Lachancea nothofagi CBS 11611 TaxID=1266666 RepID=A0A1G4K8M6_9SACH|nr:LANO_0F06744g1_1 [Lachancea nothofagi CBS 11611]